MLYIPTSTGVLQAVLLITSSTLVGIVAIWAALGTKLHWFIRYGLLSGLLLLGLFVPAYELMAMFFLQSVIVVGALTFCRALKKKPDGTREGFQFSLRDLLLFTLLIAVVLTVACCRPDNMWAMTQHFDCLPADKLAEFQANYIHLFLSSSVLFGCATLVGCLIGVPKRWLGTRLLVFVSATLLIVISRCYDCSSKIDIIAGCSCFVVPLAGWFFLLRGAGFSVHSTHTTNDDIPTRNRLHPNRIVSWTSRILLTVMSLGILMPPVYMFCLFVIPPMAPQEIAAPDPNGYDVLMHVAEQVDKKAIPDDYKPSGESLIAFERKYQAVLAEAHKAVNSPCRAKAITLEFVKKYNFTKHRERISNLCKLSGCFAAQGKLAELFGDDSDAVEYYLNQLKLGKAITHGGEFVSAWVGMGCEEMGLKNLHDIIPGYLSSEQLQELSAELGYLQVRDEYADDIADRDDFIAFYHNNWMDRYEFMLRRITKDKSVPRQCLPQRFANIQALYRIVQLEIALAQYKIKNGDYPEKLEELTPEYLDEIPEEPHGADGFIYRLKESESDAEDKIGYELYSPGPNLNDDGGGLNARFEPTVDIGFW